MASSLRASNTGKVVTACDAVRSIRDGDTVAAGGYKPRQVAHECPLAYPQQPRRFPLRQSTRLPASIRFFKSHLPYLLQQLRRSHLPPPLAKNETGHYRLGLTTWGLAVASWHFIGANCDFP